MDLLHRRVKQTVIDYYADERDHWVEECRQKARELLLTDPAITIEDVTKICPRPEGVHPNATGSIFLHPDFKKSGIPVRAKRSVANGHWISRWTLTNGAFRRLSKENQNKQLELA